MSEAQYNIRCRTAAYEALKGWETGSVYFLSPADRSMVKIGYSSSNYPVKRLKSIQTGCPYKLDLVAWMPGTRDDERELHEQLRPYRLEGEWFEMSGEVRGAMGVAIFSLPFDLLAAHHLGLLR